MSISPVTAPVKGRPLASNSGTSRARFWSGFEPLHDRYSSGGVTPTCVLEFGKSEKGFVSWTEGQFFAFVSKEGQCRSGSPSSVLNKVKPDRLRSILKKPRRYPHHGADLWFAFPSSPRRRSPSGTRLVARRRLPGGMAVSAEISRIVGGTGSVAGAFVLTGSNGSTLDFSADGSATMHGDGHSDGWPGVLIHANWCSRALPRPWTRPTRNAPADGTGTTTMREISR